MASYGFIKHLFLKQEHKTPMSAMKQIDLRRAYGINGDVNANPLSPRQVLTINTKDLNRLAISPGELRGNIRTLS